MNDLADTIRGTITYVDKMVWDGYIYINDHRINIEAMSLETASMMNDMTVRTIVR